jgi:hypothetical protein
VTITHSETFRQLPSTVEFHLKLLLVTSACAAFAGATGYRLTETHSVTLDAVFANRLQPSMYSRFAADAYAHNTSYLVGIFGGCVIIVNTWKSRQKSKLAP